MLRHYTESFGIIQEREGRLQATLWMLWLLLFHLAAWCKVRTYAEGTLGEVTKIFATPTAKLLHTNKDVVHEERLAKDRVLIEALFYKTPGEGTAWETYRRQVDWLLSRHEAETDNLVTTAT